MKRRERLDEEAIAAEEEQTRRAASHTRSKKSGAPSAVEGRSSGSNWGAPGRADDDEGTSFPDKEQIRCVDFSVSEVPTTSLAERSALV